MGWVASVVTDGCWSVMILVSKAPNSLREYWGHPSYGALETPRTGSDLTDYAAQGGQWAADNDAYSDWDEERWVRMLDRLEGVPGCMWVSAPDVVGNHTETLIRFYDYWKVIDSYGYPIALVGQDGMVPSDVPWNLVDCIFIGGTTEWKMGEQAWDLVDAAKAHDKLVHMGRVNSRRRLRYAKAIGCDSVDGTKYARFSDTWLAQDLEFAHLDAQGIM